jgi:DNA-binding PadR family transcriptional regulator
VLHDLEQAGYLRRIDRVVNGKVRKYYRITTGGAAALADARRKIGELVGELLEGHAPKKRAGPRQARHQGRHDEAP